MFSILGARGAVDENFYIYLCFGQSNMEGNAQWESPVDENVEERFQMLATCDFENPQRTVGEWYVANCPIVSPTGKLGPTDYFGRTMVAAMPASVKVGVVAVAMGGSPIEMFDKDLYQAEMQKKDEKGGTPWHVTLANMHYGGNPYGRLIEMAKKAQQVGVIKGILLHQGCSNNGDPEWPSKVKKIYNDILADLGLEAKDVPLLAGEMEREDMGGICYGHNTKVNLLPTILPTAHVVSSEGIPGNGIDGFHFSAAGYRTFGKRYAYEMLHVMSLQKQKDASYAMPENLQKFYSLLSLNADDITLRVGASKSIAVTGQFADGHTEVLTHEVSYSSSDFTVTSDGEVSATEEKKGVVTVSYTDFMGQQHTKYIHVEASMSGPNRYLQVNNGTAGANAWDKQLYCTLLKPMEMGKTYVVKAWIKAEQAGECALWPVWSESPNRDEWGNSKDLLYLTSYQVTSNSQEFTWEFNADWAIDKLQWAFGKIGGKMCFDDITCVEKGTTENMVPNGSFDSDDISKWGVITWNGQKMSIAEEAVSGIMMAHNKDITNNAIYDLNGRRVSANSLSPGIYIRDGKKFVVK